MVEKAIQELGGEMLRYSSGGGPFTAAELAYITNILNSRLRHHGLSAWEVMYQRNQFNGEQISVSDLKIAECQSDMRVANQEYSAKSKSRGNPPAQAADICCGSLVYLKDDGNKNKSRERYIVTKILGDSCTLQKITKSQLRSKPYELKLTEIYPVVSELPTIHDPLVVDCSDDDTDSLVSNDHVDSSAIDIDNVPAPLPTNNDPQVHSYDQSVGDIGNLDSIVEENENVLPLSATQEQSPCDHDLDATIAYDLDFESMNMDTLPDSRRSLRTSKPPSWMQSGDFVLDKKKKR